MAWVVTYVTVYYRWCTSGENCSSCDARDGEVYAEDEIPGSHPNCDCYLVPCGWDEEWDEEAEGDPGVARLLTFTDLSGKKVINSEGLGPTLTKENAQPPTPTYYSDYQLANL